MRARRRRGSRWGLRGIGVACGMGDLSGEAVGDSVLCVERREMAVGLLRSDSATTDSHNLSLESEPFVSAPALPSFITASPNESHASRGGKNPPRYQNAVSLLSPSSPLVALLLDSWGGALAAAPTTGAQVAETRELVLGIVDYTTVANPPRRPLVDDAIG
ncbi:hypothetical protein GUJ93_ZPchr0005g15909 [Zizania palustris]|uniref:Uncharacterized protein n=1 Tax=Zizania palustris TaxID=103762 RepID=A0A8J5W0M3_ZIZPA|nr:hypothetical protein GUJ93_ZPchr0005g15909 [Zizania palustris]